MSESSLLIQEPENDLATSTTPTPPTTTTTIGVVEESIASDSLPAAEDSLLIHGSHDDDDDNDIDEPPWNGQDSSASAAAAEEEASSSSRPLRILFLSDVTGGGHLASAEALGKQFLIQFPGSTVEICNLWTEAGDRVSRGIVQSYKHMSARPWQWQLFYHVSNTKAVELIGKNHSRMFCGQNVKARISEFQPDAVISVHPTMNHLARLQTRLLGVEEWGKHIPFYTVVTDLGSAHTSWFEPEVNKIYVASPPLVQLALSRGIKHSNICLTGLPIRHGFAIQAEALQDRTIQTGKDYQAQIRTKLQQQQLELEQPMILVMGGGEGVGSLSDIVNQLYVTLTLEGIDATLCVVCGRNESLQHDLETRNWVQVMELAVVQRAKRRKRQLLRSKMTLAATTVAATSPSNFCSPESILCDDIGQDDDDENHENSKNLFVTAPTTTTTATTTTTSSSSPMMMKIMTKLPGITEKQQKSLSPVIQTSTEHDYAMTAFAKHGNVKVIGLGFVTNMEEYMVAADILVSKAGPGTIAEAAAVGLPIMLTSYLPGQEAGNVDVVLEAGFGDYCEDPVDIAARVAGWLQEESVLETMSQNARKAGNPHAASDIVKDIGSETVTWMKMNERWKDDPIYKPVIEMGHTLVLDSYLKNGKFSNLEDVAAQAAAAAEERDPKATKRSTLATAAGVGVGAAVGAVVAGPLLPIGLVLGGAIIPALPVGLAVGGTVSGLAANKIARRSAAATTPQVEEEVKEGEEKEQDEVAPNSRWFGWRAEANMSAPTTPTLMGEHRASWFAWKAKTGEPPESIVSTDAESELVPEPVQ